MYFSERPKGPQIELHKERPSWRRPKSIFHHTILQISQNTFLQQKQIIKIKKVYCRIDPRCQKAILLEEAKSSFVYTIFKIVITFLLSKCRVPYEQLRRFWTLWPSCEGLYRFRIT